MICIFLMKCIVPMGYVFERGCDPCMFPRSGVAVILAASHLEDVSVFLPAIPILGVLVL